MNNYDYIIVGGGASGLMMAYRMANDTFFDDKTILILDKEKKSKNDRTWCYWQKEDDEWDDILHTSWNQIFFNSNTVSLQKNISPYTYKLIRSSFFYKKIWTTLEQKNNITFLKSDVKAIEQLEYYATVITRSETFKTHKVLNSILFDKEYLDQKQYPVLKQHFVGWFVEVNEPIFDDDVATFMDFKIPQKGNTRFMYVLPLNKKVALFEYTLFSEDLLAYQDYEQAIKDYLKEKNITNYTIVEKENGVIPMTAYKFWKKNSNNIIHMGTAGGWSKASTGFTFKNITKKTKELTTFLKSEKPLTAFQKKSKFWYYDLLLLDVLSEKNKLGASIFSTLFKKNNSTQILKFLDEETSFLEDISIMFKMPPYMFMKVLLKRLF